MVNSKVKIQQKDRNMLAKNQNPANKFLQNVPEKTSSSYGIFQNLKKAGIRNDSICLDIRKGVDSRGIFKTVGRSTRTAADHIHDLQQISAMDKNARNKKNKRRLQKLYRQADTYLRVTPEASKAFTDFTAWRLVREYARIFGIIQSDECLTESLDNRGYYSSLWYTPKTVDPRSLATKKFYSHVEEVIDLCLTAEYLPEELQESREDPITKSTRTYPGLALMPPDIPQGFRNCPDHMETYKPEDDPRLVLYCKIMELMAFGLGVYNGSRDFVDMGNIAMQNLTNPATVRDFFPTPQELINVEEGLIEEVSEYVRKNSMNRTRDKLIRQYGFTRQEVASLIRLAKNQVQSEMGTVAEEKAFAILHLEDISERAKDQGDIRAELAVAKEKHRLLGLDTKSGEDEDNEDFADIICDLTQERQEIREKEQGKLEDFES